MSKLPENWVTAKLGALGVWSGGGTPSKSNPTFWEGGTIPWVSPKDMKFVSIDDSQDHITESAVKGSATKILPKGSLLVVTRSGILQHSLPVATNSRDVTLNQDLKALTPKDGFDVKYLYFALRRFERDILHACCKAGTTVQSIEFPRLKDFEIPIAPLSEQRRIVARIEELFSRLDAGVAALRHAKAQLQRYRQSVLAAAVTGQLTQAWREQHPVTEPAAKLLESILSERRLNWRGRGKYEVPVKPEGVFDELPASWEPITFGHICQVQGGFAFKSNDFVSEGINLVKIASLRAGKVDLDHNPTYLPSDYLAEYSRFALRKGDTLIAMSGATTGKMGVYESEDPALLNQRVGRFLPYTKTNVTAGFLSLLVEQIGDRVLKEAYGAAQPNISPTEIEEMPFPLPPLVEQHQIVAEVEARTTAIDHLAADLDRQITRSNRLRQSTLGSAFEGNL